MFSTFQALRHLDGRGARGSAAAAEGRVPQRLLLYHRLQASGALHRRFRSSLEMSAHVWIGRTHVLHALEV
jgi:hypothetical protein